MDMTFNLIDDPWIPVLTLRGRSLTLGLRDTLHRAGEISLVSGGELGRVALLRLLAAVHHRALDATDSHDEDHIRGLYRANRLDDGAIDLYLDSWHHAFDLCDPERPFLQVPGLAMKDKPIQSINVDNHDQFVLDRREQVPPADAALMLVKHLAYDWGGIKPNAVGDRRARGGKLYPPNVIGTGRPGPYLAMWADGGTLARTILLADPSDGTDAPAWWETGVPGYEMIGRSPRGVADEYSTPTRRVLLRWRDGMAVAARSTYGIIPDDDNHGLDPMHAPSRSGLSVKREYIQATMLWQALTMTMRAYGRPATIDWATRICPPDDLVTVHAAGAVYTNLVKLADFDDMTLKVPVRALDDPDLYAATDAVRLMCRQCGQIMADMERITGRDTQNQFRQTRSRRHEDELCRIADPIVRRGLIEGDYDRIVHTAYQELHEWLNDWADQLMLDVLRGTARRKCDGKDYPQWRILLFGALKGRLNDWIEYHTGTRPAPRFWPTGEPKPTAETGGEQPGRGRRVSVVRSGGGLPDQTFPSMKAAVKWLKTEGGRPNAGAGWVSKAVSRGGNAYGFTWRREEEQAS